ncbi:MAG: hypothetical protein K8H88_20410 [Sandaracinaceae bacterium]|nr:hypothetical protein [Sandaracinaceae bacterium]
MLLRLHEILLANLDRRFEEEDREFIPREVAHARLVELCGVDLGWDSARWAEWFEKPENLQTFLERHAADGRPLWVRDELDEDPREA